MIKTEAIRKIKLNKGYIQYNKLFDLYKDDDIIPDWIIKLELESNTKYKAHDTATVHIFRHIK